MQSKAAASVEHFCEALKYCLHFEIREVKKKKGNALLKTRQYRIFAMQV